MLDDVRCHSFYSRSVFKEISSSRFSQIVSRVREGIGTTTVFIRPGCVCGPFLQDESVLLVRLFTFFHIQDLANRRRGGTIAL